MRIFLAVELPTSLRRGLASFGETLAREGARGARWADPGGIHLTLRFLGEASSDQMDRLDRSLGAGPPISPFTLRLRGTGVFPPRGAPRVLWVGVDSSPLLDRLASWVEARVTEAGFPPEDRPFHPHLTLARFRDGEARLPRGVPGDLPEEFSDPVPVDQIVLFRSLLGPEGARHEAIRTIPLGSAASTGEAR